MYLIFIISLCIPRINEENEWWLLCLLKEKQFKKIDILMKYSVK